jgi:hypothetical protein
MVAKSSWRGKGAIGEGGGAALIKEFLLRRALHCATSDPRIPEQLISYTRFARWNSMSLSETTRIFKLNHKNKNKTEMKSNISFVYNYIEMEMGS